MAVAERIEVADAPARERYELSVNGDVIGFTAYHARPGLIAFVHTEVDERLQGRGIGDRLIRFALEDSRARGLAVLPFCPFVKAFIGPSRVRGLGSRDLQGAVRLVKRYEGEHIEVTYDARRCLHAAECVRGMPAVFNTAKRPWIAPDAAEAGALAGVIRRCPTGALHYTLREGELERPSVPTQIRLQDNGPLLIEGDLELDGKRETRAALCRCGQSANQPYCDRSGPCRQWEYRPAG